MAAHGPCTIRERSCSISVKHGVFVRLNKVALPNDTCIAILFVQRHAQFFVNANLVYRGQKKVTERSLIVNGYSPNALNIWDPTRSVTLVVILQRWHPKKLSIYSGLACQRRTSSWRISRGIRKYKLSHIDELRIVQDLKLFSHVNPIQCQECGEWILEYLIER